MELLLLLDDVVPLPIHPPPSNTELSDSSLDCPDDKLLHRSDDLLLWLLTGDSCGMGVDGVLETDIAGDCGDDLKGKKIEII